MHRGGSALIFAFAREGIMKSGHIAVEIAARTINHNNANNPVSSLKPFNPVRYDGTFVIANNSATANEIIAQVGRLLKSNLWGGPLQRYHVEKVVLSGTSDSSGATRTYMGSATSGHSFFRMPDGGPIYDGYFLTAILGSGTVQEVDVPVVAMPTQFEAQGLSGGFNGTYRKPDNEDPGFRIYEVAGMSHNDSRENPIFIPDPCGNPVSKFAYGAMTFMGLKHLVRWVRWDKAPPHAPDYIHLVPNPAGGNQIVEKDEFGNAAGGVRTTYLNVPFYTYTIPNSVPTGGTQPLCTQTAYQTPLADAVLKDLYRSGEDYLEEVEDQLWRLTRQGWFPKEYRKVVLRDARANAEYIDSLRPRKHRRHDDDDRWNGSHDRDDDDDGNDSWDHDD